MNKDEKYEVEDVVYCVDESSYEIHLTKRKKYNVHQIGEDSKEGKIRIKSDLGRLVWLSDTCFSKINQPEIQSINLDDKIEDKKNEFIEVTITFKNNHKRWVTFMTTQYLRELIERQNGSFHSSKIIYVNLMNPEIVHKTILELDKSNELFKATNAY